MKYYRFQVFRRESKKELNTAKKLPLIMMLSQLQHLQLPFFSYFVHCLFFHMHLFVALSWIKYKIPWKCLTRPKAAWHSKYSYCHPMSCSVFYRVLRNWEGKLCFSRDTWYLNNGNSSGSLCLFLLMFASSVTVWVLPIKLQCVLWSQNNMPRKFKFQRQP